MADQLEGGARRSVNRVNSRLEPKRHVPIPSYALTPRSIMRYATLIGCVLVIVACDSGSLTAGPTATCKESGVQCQLPTGPLGVCERSHCEPG